jgi:hypothetical protein
MGFLLVLLSLLKTAQEDKLMAESFPKDYRQYSKSCLGFVATKISARHFRRAEVLRSADAGA